LPFEAHQKRWTGYQYDDMGALVGEFVRQTEDLPAGVLPQRQDANYSTANANVANLFDPPQTGAVETVWSRNALGSLLHREDVATQTRVWEKQLLSAGQRMDRVFVDGGSIDLAYDDAGQMTSDEVFDYHYNPAGRLVAATDPSNGALVEGYLYDANGGLTAVVSPSSVQEFHRVDDQIVAAYTENDLDWQAVWGPGVDNLLEWRDRDGSSDYIPLVDHRNSVVGAWDMMAGSLTEVADYTAQGRLTLRDELEQPTCAEEGNPGTLCDSPGGMPFAFNSRWRSPRTGLVNMRARWYSPKLGQFTSHDPLGYVDTQNLYAFAAFDPINGWDPFGLERTAYYSNPEDGTASPYATGVEPPQPGKVKYFVISRNLDSSNGFRHSYIWFVDESGTWYQAEVGERNVGSGLDVYRISQGMPGGGESSRIVGLASS
jgi:RHS repeat-associated protein